VRSSATAEDLPHASFAGQQDSFLDVVGREEILAHIRKCWASLFTDRAVAYRERNGFDHTKVRMAVIVQRMVEAEASGVMFTADPVSGNRKIVSIEAVRGLGEALVSGRVNPDEFKVRDGRVVESPKHTPRSTRGDRPADARGDTVTNAQLVQLAEVGRRIEAHFGSPQDIEWCLGKSRSLALLVTTDEFWIVQSRPITTLYPIPKATDEAPHVYISTGHQQMMTDANKPLGISMRQLSAWPAFLEAGGRLYIDVTRMLSTPSGRAGLLNLVGKGEPLVGDALRTLIDREFIPLQPDPANPPAPPVYPKEIDPALPAQLIREAEESIAKAEREIATRSGPALFDFILEDLKELKRVLSDPRTHQLVMIGWETTVWLNEKLEEWLGEKNSVDVLSQSAPNNVTSEMGLALLDVADAIRSSSRGRSPRDLPSEALENRSLALRARDDKLEEWLRKYGMRGVGEIDITRPRWAERPELLIPLIESNIRNFEPGEAKRRFDQGLREAANKEKVILGRLRALPDGEAKAAETKQMIDRLRAVAGYREYPKYAMMWRFFIYKQALMKEADRLAQAGVIGDREDIFYLTLPELHEVSRTHIADRQLIERRKEEFRFNETLTPPRIITSEGEMLNGTYRRAGIPDGALVGLGVSAGTVEGRARIVLDIEHADLAPGDILVTTFTDPSWTPVFVSISGLVTEIGGLTTHGAVIAREYGLPAVVSVPDATKKIRDGQRIRVHGTEGYVEPLPE
jgi:pyruvate,water dikinase